MKTLNDIIWNDEELDKKQNQSSELSKDTYAYGNQIEMCCTGGTEPASFGFICE